MTMANAAPVFEVVGRRDSGKTSLITKLLQELTDRCLKISTVKKAVIDVELDRPGKDSHKHRLAGADFVLMRNGQPR